MELEGCWVWFEENVRLYRKRKKESKGELKAESVEWVAMDRQTSLRGRWGEMGGGGVGGAEGGNDA